MRLRTIAFGSVVGFEPDWLVGRFFTTMPSELNEQCDKCGRQVAALNAYFDGKQFLCPNCKQRRADLPRCSPE